MTALVKEPRPITLAGTNSFYLSPTNLELIRECSTLTDAVVLRGPNGPRRALQLRRTGWDGIVLFDRAAYESGSSPVDSTHWFEQQTGSDADRILTPGAWVPWDKTGDEIHRAVESEWRIGQAAPGSTLVLAIDSRWLTRGFQHAWSAFSGLDVPLALVLAHRQDPLAARGAVEGFASFAHGLSDLTVMRCDHGVIGALAYGLAHGSMGLRSTYRHFVPPQVSGGGIPDDRTPRVFVEDLMDWFTAATIAGWGTTNVRLSCARACCEGATFDRFLDPKFEAAAQRHNRVTLAQVADYILNAPQEERRRHWAELCARAVAKYGPMGKFSDIIKAKAQLQAWASIA